MQQKLKNGAELLILLCSRLEMEAVAMEADLNNSAVASDPKPLVTYRCKKCRRLVASEDHIVCHERGGGQKSFKWKKRSADTDVQVLECSSIFVEPMKWMEALEEGCVGDKLQCIGCKARLGSFNWAGMQCNCGAWINPAFQLHKSRLDECHY
ncbi:probable inactive dual specificity protein phosphatase-like At4g18593 [Salvia hispanica]|uniref:probable inactive dual specificity protein phosphatase-like At4g18593 n=1 Tax=Salvia hispanica TaxID=49212 RepID=UPI00200944FF|nr:probable inactive dual specificity protein phosphatase-like At4g18593 [Salvia hispanica]